MNLDCKLNDEDGRLAALHRYDLLDSPPEVPFDKLTELVRNVLNVPIAAVSLIDSERQWFKSIAGLPGGETAREASFCTYTIKRREPMVVPDATLDSRFAKNPSVTGHPFVRSYLGIPLQTPDGYNIGALCAIDTQARVFTANDITILSSFATLVLNEIELRQIAMSDALTGAMTRRAWIAAAENELSRSRRHGTDASIVLFDIDHFKQVNDTHGHPAGDAVLKVLVRRCFGTMRDGDMLGRIGGEEFALLLPQTSAQEAAVLAERLRSGLAPTPMQVPDGALLPVTASFGISGRMDDMASVDAWIAAADACLYTAKNGGRNRCCGPVMTLTSHP